MRDYEIGIESYNNLVALVEKKINEDARLADVYEMCADALRGYQGKVINVRIEKAIQLKGYKASYSKYYNSPALHIRREANDIHEHYTIYIGDKGQQRFNVEYLKTKAKGLKEKAAKDRLAAAGICGAVSKFNTALTCYKQAEKELTSLPHFYEWNKY